MKSNVIRWTKTQGFESFPVDSLLAGHRALIQLMAHRIHNQGAAVETSKVEDLAGNQITKIDINRPNAPAEQYWLAALDPFVDTTDQQ